MALDPSKFDASSVRAAPERKQGTERQSIRFYLDNSYLTTDSRACRTVGQVVPQGISDGTPCPNESAVNNCDYTCTSDDVLDANGLSLIENAIMPAVLEVFETSVKIDRVEGNLFLNKAIWTSFDQECNTGVAIPESWVEGGTGIPNADMVVFGTVRPSPSIYTVAYAGACNFDWDMSSQTGIFGRPLAALVNFSPRYFQNLGSVNAFTFNSMVRVGIHEFTHAMGFSSFFYDSYLDKTGSPYLGGASGSRFVSGTSPSGSSFGGYVTYLTTPKVKEAVQKHYGCDAPYGGELEEYGGSGTAGSHWELRAVKNELMGGYVNPLMPLSHLTLGLFEDMGWYEPNYTQAEYWAWGKNEGCGFINERCENSWGPKYFCTSGGVEACSPDRVAKAVCNLVDYNQVLNPYYQHVQNPELGGANIPMDACPHYEDSTICADPTNVQYNANEVFGPDSLCFEFGTGLSNLGCFTHRCTGSALEVQIGSEWLTCPANGGTVTSAAVGSVNCPSYSLVCREIEMSYTPPTGGQDSAAAAISESQQAVLTFAFGFTFFCLFFQEFVLSFCW
eukprot:TRINITY_DN1386_c0_g1_i1.p1 TRINITY_DN1386_c0_g1~~TRINITY_DN1386_c0_g1_i1.p1  ORF type:complete len:652 (-),score=128.29 TRINITY_DN1386_c0_g1_i1:65-1747(-)